MYRTSSPNALFCSFIDSHHDCLLNSKRLPVAHEFIMKEEFLRTKIKVPSRSDKLHTGRYDPSNRFTFVHNKSETYSCLRVLSDNHQLVAYVPLVSSSPLHARLVVSLRGKLRHLNYSFGKTARK